MQKEGLIRHLGLSEVSIEEIKAASKHFRVTTVQNKYNLIDRASEDVLTYCEGEKIGFIPWFPLASGELAKGHSAVTDIAKRLDVGASQVALAWVLKRSPVMLPIPGTSRVSHLKENVAAASLKLTDADFKALDEQGRAVWKKAA
jgi:aryl-alcohol dehydrogenase-like predicted oxidoreductase